MSVEPDVTSSFNEKVRSRSAAVGHEDQDQNHRSRRDDDGIAVSEEPPPPSVWSLSQEDLSAADKNPFLELSQDQIQKLESALSSEQAKRILGETSTQFGLGGDSATHKHGFPLGTIIPTSSSSSAESLERTIEDSLRFIMSQGTSGGGGVKSDEDFIHGFYPTGSVIQVSGTDLLVGDGIEVECCDILVGDDVQVVREETVGGCEDDETELTERFDLAHYQRCISLDHDYCHVKIVPPQPPPPPPMIPIVDALSTLAEGKARNQVSSTEGSRGVLSPPVRRSQRQIDMSSDQPRVKPKVEVAAVCVPTTSNAAAAREWNTVRDDQLLRSTADEGNMSQLDAASQSIAAAAAPEQSERVKAECGEEHAASSKLQLELQPSATQTTSDVAVSAELTPMLVPNEPKVKQPEADSQVVHRSKTSGGGEDAPRLQNEASVSAVLSSPSREKTIVRTTTPMKSISMAELKDCDFLAAPPQQLFACDGEEESSFPTGIDPEMPLLVAECDSLHDLASGTSSVTAAACLKTLGEAITRTTAPTVTSEKSAFEKSSPLLHHMLLEAERNVDSGSDKEITGKSLASLSPTSGPRKSYPKRENRKPPGRLMDMFEPALFSKPDRLKKIDQDADFSSSAKPTDVDSKHDGCTAGQQQDSVEEYFAALVDEPRAMGLVMTTASVVKNAATSVSTTAGALGRGDELEAEEEMPLSALKSALKDKTFGTGKSEVRRLSDPFRKGINKSRRPSKKKMRSPSASSSRMKKKAQRAAAAAANSQERTLSSSDDSDSSDSSDWCSEDDPDRLWCICKQPHNDRFMIRCDGCEDWFHGSCVGVTRKQGRELEKSGKEWVCTKCITARKAEKSRVKDGSAKPVEVRIADRPPAPKITDRPRMGHLGLAPTPTAPKQVMAEAKPQKKPVKLVKGVPRAPEEQQQPQQQQPALPQPTPKVVVPVPPPTVAAPPTSKLCIVGCGRPSRSDSIYCSSECIVQHANESLKIIGHEKEKSRQQLAKKTPFQAFGGARRSLPSTVNTMERIVVLERRSGRILTGPNAPTEINLHDWLKQNPTFEVFRPAKKDIQQRRSLYADVRQREQAKTIKLISAKPMPAEPPIKESPRSRMASAERKLSVDKTLEAKTPEKQEPASIEKKVESVARRTSLSLPPPVHVKMIPVPTVSTSSALVHALTTQIPSSALSMTTTTNTSAPPTPTPPPPPHPPLTPSPSPSSSSSTSAAAPGPEPIRLNVRKTLKDILTSRSSDADDAMLSSDEIKGIALRIEEELFKYFGDTGTKYKAKYRSLMFNIKDSRNHGLFRKILRGKISPHKLVRMTPEELASKELAMWRERETKHTLEMIKREQEELALMPIIKKTHKGEIEIDDIGFAEKSKSDVDNQSGALLLDTTDAHRSHLFDLNCKICTGKMLPPADNEKPLPKEVKVAKSISVELKDVDDGDDNDDDDDDEDVGEKRPPTPPPPKKAKLEKKKTAKKSDKVSAKTVDKKADKTKTTTTTTTAAVKKESVAVKKEPEGDGKKTKVKVVKVAKSSSDAVKRKKAVKKTSEPPILIDDTSTTDPILVTTSSSSSSKAAAPAQSVWKGFIMMQDVTKFVTTAHKVSGSTLYLDQDIPNTIQVCGRIKPNMVWDYVSKMKRSASKEFLVVRFSPANDEEKVAYLAFYSYLSSRNRFGVVAISSKMIKDFYIVPLSSDSAIPASMLPFKGPGLDEDRPHLLLGIIIRHKGKRSASTIGDKKGSKLAKKKRSSVTAVDATTTDQSSSNDAITASSTTATTSQSKTPAKKVKFNLKANTSLENVTEPYEPSYTPPLVGPTYKPTATTTASVSVTPISDAVSPYEIGGGDDNSRSFTPPIPSAAATTTTTTSTSLKPSDGSDSPYDPMDSDVAAAAAASTTSKNNDEDNKPYDPEEAEQSVARVSKTLIPGLLQSGSVSSKSISELIEQISMSSNPSGITSTVLASIATATNLEQQRKLLLELTHKVEEQKKQLERQKQQIATKVITQQVMGVMNPYTLTSPSIALNVLPSTSSVVSNNAPIVTATVAGGLQSMLPVVKSETDTKSGIIVNEDMEAYSPSYTPPPPSASVEGGAAAAAAAKKLPNASVISLPPNLQEILESIKKKSTIKSEVAPTPMPQVQTQAPASTKNTLAEDPIVKKFSSLDEDDKKLAHKVEKMKEVDNVVIKSDKDEEETSSKQVQVTSGGDPRLKSKITTTMASAATVDPRTKLPPTMQTPIPVVPLPVPPPVVVINTSTPPPPIPKKTSELGSLSATELMEKALKQFEEIPPQPPLPSSASPMANCPLAHIPMPMMPAAPLHRQMMTEPPPPGFEASQHSTLDAAMIYPSAPPSVPRFSSPSAVPSPYSLPPPLPPQQQRHPGAIFPAYRSTSFPPVPPSQSQIIGSGGPPPPSSSRLPPPLPPPPPNASSAGSDYWATISGHPSPYIWRAGLTNFHRGIGRPGRGGLGPRWPDGARGHWDFRESSRDGPSVWLSPLDEAAAGFRERVGGGLDWDRERDSRNRRDRRLPRRDRDRGRDRSRDRSPDSRGRDRDRSPDNRRDRERSPDSRGRDRERSPDSRGRDRERSPDSRRDRDRSPDSRGRDRDRSPDSRRDRERSPDSRGRDRERSPGTERSSGRARSRDRSREGSREKSRERDKDRSSRSTRHRD